MLQTPLDGCPARLGGSVQRMRLPVSCRRMDIWAMDYCRILDLCSHESGINRKSLIIAEQAGLGKQGKHLNHWEKQTVCRVRRGFLNIAAVSIHIVHMSWGAALNSSRSQAFHSLNKPSPKAATIERCHRSSCQKSSHARVHILPPASSRIRQPAA